MTLATETIKLWRNNAGITAGETAEDDPEHIAAKAILALTAELLANREAQPVAVTDEMALAFHRALNDGGIGESDLEEIKVGLRGALCNITAPPAPATKTFDEFWSSFKHPFAEDDELKTFSLVIWNACRAAMLAQPVSSGYTLPDGWIACSEQMPDNDETKPIAIYTGKCLGQGMFVATYDEDGFFDYWEGGEIIGVTHWMPLPAAPEGGNG